MTTPDSPEDLIRKWEAGARPPIQWDSRHEDHERWLEREERLDTACTWTLGLFALLGVAFVVHLLWLGFRWLF